MAAESIQLSVKPRSELGSRANKRLRDAGNVPGVIYGHKEAVVPVTLAKKELTNHLNRGAHVFDLALDGKSEKVLVKEVQYDHLGIEVIHVDFARVSLDEKVEVTVPLELKGTPKGEADGGVLQQLITDLEVECLVTDIPAAIRHSVADMGLDSVLHVTQKVVEGETPAAPVAEMAEPEVIGRKPEEGEEAAAESK